MDEYVATVQFTDGQWRPAYDQADGRKWVIDGDCEDLYGVWFFPPDEITPTVIVNATPAALRAAEQDFAWLFLLMKGDRFRLRVMASLPL